MKGLRSFLLVVVATGLLVSSSGCAANRAGFIALSRPKVWHDNAIVATTDYQLKKIEEFGKTANLTALQGRRLRSYLRALGLSGTFGVGLPPPPASPDPPPGGGTAAARLANQRQTGVVTVDDLTKLLSGVKEDPLDGLRRLDDFYQVFGGLRLTHLRDTTSMDKGWSMYLVGFDISLMPGDKTSEGHGAYVELQVEVDPKDANKAKHVYVYSVWPQRYADRFGEALSVREDFYLTLTGKAQGEGWSAQMVQDLAQRYEEDLAHIQRYPLISGFIKGPQCFGWEFNPRVRIVTKERWILPDRPKPKFWLEPGMRHCYALLAVEDGRIWADKRLVKLGEDDLRTIARSGDTTLMDLVELKKMYHKVIDQLPEAKERCALRDLLKKIEGNVPVQVRNAEGKALSEEALEELHKQRFEELKRYHRLILLLCGRQGKGGIRTLTLTAKCHWFNRSKGNEEESDGHFFGELNSTTVVLPDKLDRTLERAWAVWPEKGLFDRPTTVTIKGQNFSNDARVFVGGKEAPPELVTVLGRDFIVATFPALAENKNDNVLAEGEEKRVCVKVITGGDSLTAEDAFTYYRPKKPTTPGAQAGLGKQQQTGGAAGTALELEKLFRKIGDIVVTFSIRLPKDLPKTK